MGNDNSDDNDDDGAMASRFQIGVMQHRLQSISRICEILSHFPLITFSISSDVYAWFREHGQACAPSQPSPRVTWQASHYAGGFGHGQLDFAMERTRLFPFVSRIPVSRVQMQRLHVDLQPGSRHRLVLVLGSLEAHTAAV
jgi:hypothetical protein